MDSVTQTSTSSCEAIIRHASIISPTSIGIPPSPLQLEKQKSYLFPLWLTIGIKKTKRYPLPIVPSMEVSYKLGLRVWCGWR
jgi:hypothetical protein